MITAPAFANRHRMKVELVPEQCLRFVTPFRNVEPEEIRRCDSARQAAPPRRARSRLWSPSSAASWPISLPHFVHQYPSQPGKVGDHLLNLLGLLVDSRVFPQIRRHRAPLGSGRRPLSRRPMDTGARRLIRFDLCCTFLRKRGPVGGRRLRVHAVPVVALSELPCHVA
jgi:hypothetical protein